MLTQNAGDIEERLEQILSKAGARDRAIIEKRLATLGADANSERNLLWRRLLLKLSDLVPLPVHPVGANALQFFVPDGKYRMQVFALDDAGEGLLILYLPDVLAKAVSKKLLVKKALQYSLAEAPNEFLKIEQMDVSALNPPDFMKHMIGWNRKALKFTLHIAPKDNADIKAAERLCELAAMDWNRAKVAQ